MRTIAHSSPVAGFAAKPLPPEMGRPPTVIDAGVRMPAMPNTSTIDGTHPNQPSSNQIKKLAMERGLMCYPMGGTIDGVHGNHILMAPPYNIDEQHVEEMVDKLGSAVDTAIAQSQR